MTPGVHFALVLLHEPKLAAASIWVLLGVYIGAMFVPAARRISRESSLVALVASLTLAMLAMLFANELKRGVALAVGFYVHRVPWKGARLHGSTASYRNTFAEYTLRVPVTWQERRGPIPDTTEFVLPHVGSTALAARLRPSCDLSHAPLAVTVAELLRTHTHLNYRCGHSNGVEACLLDYGPGSSDAGAATRWEWLGRDGEHDINIRLTFDLWDTRSVPEALAIIDSVHPASVEDSPVPCPNPREWSDE